MENDPVENTAQFKAIAREVEHKTQQHLLDGVILALKKIIDNGFTSYSMEYDAFGAGRLPDYDENFEEIPPGREEALEMEQKCRARLNDIEELLQAGKPETAYETYVVKGLGFCHRYWAVQKSILLNEYGIDWKTPAEMNPDMCFD